jgi:hypothetical protein
MALLALPAATVNISDPAFGTTALPAAETALTGNTGVTFPNDPDGLVVVRIVIGGAGAGNATIVGNLGAANVVKAVSNSTIYIWGPFDPSLYSNNAGLVQINFSVVTGNSAGVYLLPALHPLTTMRALHNPFQMIHGASDR